MEKVNNCSVISETEFEGCGTPIKREIGFDDLIVGSRVKMGNSKTYVVFQNDSRGLILKPE